MKKFFSLFPALVLLFVLCACGGSSLKNDVPSVSVVYAKYQTLIDALEAGEFDQAHAIITAMEPDLPAPSPTPVPYVESVKVFFYDNDLSSSDFTMKLSHGEDGDITLRAEAYPSSSESRFFTWSVDREGIIELTPGEDSSECLIHQVGILETGVVITVKCAGASCTVRCLAFE